MLSPCLAMLDEPSDQAKFTAIFHKYERAVYCEAKNIVGDHQLAEDVLQEVFLYLAKNFHRLPINNCYSLHRYLVLCARSRALNLLQKQQREKAHCPESLDYMGDYMEDAAQSAESIEDALIDADEIKALIKLVAQLPELYRIPMELNASGLNTTEIAEMLGITAAAVRKRMERGRKMILERVRRNERKKCGKQ